MAPHLCINGYTMAKNIERAKQFQRALWNAAGKEWEEKDFVESWINKPTVTQWDEWYEKGLVPVALCALCGDDNLRGAYHKSSGLRSEVPINLCKACYKKHYPYLFKSPLDQIIGFLSDYGCLILTLFIGFVLALLIICIIAAVFYLLKWILA